MAIEYVGNGAPDGTVVFQSGEKGGFYGLATAIVQPTGATKVTTGSTATTTQLAIAVNTLVDAFAALGLTTTVSGYQ